MKTKITGIYEERWWLDYLEGEMSPELSQDMGVLLSNSLADRRLLRDLERTRTAVREADEVALPEDGRVYDRLHDKIMMAVEESAASDSARGDFPVEMPNIAAMWTALTRRW